MRIRALATVIVASALLLGTAGCGVFVETATLKQYDASDGVSADIGDMHVRNALIITNEAGDAALIGSIINDGTSFELLTVEIRGTIANSTQIGIYPGLTKLGIADDNPIVLYGAGVTPGQNASVYIQYGANDGQLLSVPVLDGSLAIYAPYVPDALAPAVVDAP